ncbi:MAG: Serine/threonine protein kinase PrkC, regulator of stationary phase [Myxococcaceae bacterium]|nr:Serine/threonine protein kinase PrkC, regulator of stationary phase [Myxococcaceae bacterium]
MADPHVPTVVNPTHLMDPTVSSGRSQAVDLGATTLAEPPGKERYEQLKLLGAGGMGDVHLCRDGRIGREVARKVMRPEAAAYADGRDRFLREARVQGQLEHPAVVPVYELGEEAGAPFFTMKRVRGQTLGQLLNALAEGDPQTRRQYTRRRLLTAFSQLCVAIDFAHSRGVLHRDLKPENVMLGDFGEVHVLDWGLARVAGVEDSPGLPALSAGAPGATQAGTMMGTPGYMAPEQAEGNLPRLAGWTDVYALGAILFELLTLERLHDQPTSDERVLSTLAGREVHPMQRSPERDVPVELDALVARACAFAPEQRPSARELSEEIERFLDGDRDLERRRELAKACVAAAQTAMGRPSGRAEAMREVTRALALVPDEPAGLRILGRLLTEVPAELPPAARSQMEAAQAAARVGVVGVAASRAATWLAFVPLILWMGVRDWRLALFALGALSLSFFAAFYFRLRGEGLTNLASLGLLLLSSFALAGFGFVLSPFVLVPALAATNTLFFATYLSSKVRPLAALSGVVAVLAPVGLEALGVLPRSFAFADGHLELLPRMTALAPGPTLVLLLAGSVALVVTPAVLVGRLRDSLEAAEKKLFLQAWHLNALAPSELER